ncbi:titin homolog isoform X2 [Carassius gibelio]|uniref:titin homolog isoform X2 n=1 Tax=Carassius gibelio TaxID=101364 RepID=UPI002278FAD7|nr:titin homolog isoform X2 [Carassius gibelio]
MDDDIEKRVLVNKDGSLSMEMKVRFRLLHNETLHWSTEVKKAKSTFNESHIVHDDARSLSHGSAESCSEADSLAAGEADEAYSTKRYQRHFEEPHCQHCCAHCQRYDIWKNPVPPDQGSVRRIRSSSSSASSRRIVCKMASTDSIRTMSSEEYTEHVVEKATCIQRTFGQQGDSTVEQCTINHCRSRSEVRSMSPKTKSTSVVEDKPENAHVSENEENRPDVISSNLPKDQLSVQITQPVEEEERPVSVVSSSSQILALLKEDQDDEDVDLPLSTSGTSHGQQEDEESKDAEPNPCSTTSCKSPASPSHLSPRPPSKASSLGQSKRSRKLVSPEVDDEEGRSEASAAHKASSRLKYLVTKDLESPGDSESTDQFEDIQHRTDVQEEEKDERALSALSAKSKTSVKSLSECSASCENENDAEFTGANSEITEERCSSAISIKSNISGKSNKTNVSEVLEKDGRAPSAMSVKSQKSDKSRITDISDIVSEEQISEVRTSSVMSVKSNISIRSKVSDVGFFEPLQDNVEERAVSAVSSKSNISDTSSQSEEPHSVSDGALEERIEEKASSIKSGTSNKSGIKAVTNDDQTVERAPSSISVKSNICARSKMSIERSELEDEDRASRSISVQSNVSHKSKSDMSEAASFQGDDSLNSVKLNTPEAEAALQTELPGERSPSSVSSKSNTSTRSTASKNVEAEQDEAQEKEDVQERASSAISVKSTISARSRKSETTPKSGEEIKEKAPSFMSVKSNASLKSNKSKMEEEEIENRASSALSVNSEVSTLSKKSNQSDVEQMEKRPSSARSAKSNISVRSKGSKMSEVAGDDAQLSAAALHISEASNECSTAPEEPCIGTEKSPDKEKRAPSALSTKSNKSKISDMADDVVAGDGDDLRSASAMSSKSNVSVKSAVSELVTEEPLKAQGQTEERAQSALSAQSSRSGVTVSEAVEVAEERPLSAMSSKSSASERSKKSNNLKVLTALPQAGEYQTEERAQSALSARSSVSAISNKSKMLDVLTDEIVDVKDQEERASSALSAKSSISAKSKASATDVKADDKEKGDRVTSAMSARSDISTKTSISAKSKASNVSEIPPEEPDDEESEVKAPSITKSSISVRSNKSKHSGMGAEEEVLNIERPPSSISVISDVTHDENEITNDGEIQERAPSAASTKSRSSVRSRTSNVSGIIIYEPDKEKVERAPSSRSLKSDASGRSDPNYPVNIEKEARTESALSSISARSKKSEDSEIISSVGQRASSTASVTSARSARSKRSNISELAPKEIGNTDTGDVRTSSAMSAKSCSSEKSKCSERTTEEDESASKMVDRTTSSLSVKSNPSITSDATVKSSAVPTKSNASAKFLLSEAEEPDRRSTSVASNASAQTKMSKAGVNTKASHSPSRLSVKSNVSTRSKKSKVSEGEDRTHTNTEDTELNRDESPLSDHSKVSQTENSNECICGAINKPSSPVASSEKNFDHEEIPTSPLSKKSAKSEVSSVGSAYESVFTPTSTSVSIGIVEDHEADDVEEIDGGVVSINSASSLTEICGKSDQCLSESPVEITNEATLTTEERPKSSASAKSNVSGKSKSKSSHCGSTCPTDTIQERDDVASNTSSKIKYLTTLSVSKPSANSSMRQSSQTQGIRPSSKASNVSVHTEITGQEKAESPDVTHKSQSVCSKCSSKQKIETISHASSASAITDSEKSKTKERSDAEITDRPKSNKSSSSSRLKVNGQKNDVEATVVNEKSNKLKTKSTQKTEDNALKCHSATSVASGNQLSPNPPKSPKKSKKPVILLGSSNDSMLSQNVPAPKPKEEYIDHLNAAAEKPQSCRSDTNVSEIKSEKSSKCRKRIGSGSSCHKMDGDMSELSPSSLPNASPTEVVNEWLKKIPSDTTLCDLGDEFHDNYDSIEPLCTLHLPSGDDNDHGSLPPSDVTKIETQNEMEDTKVANTEGATDKKSPALSEGDQRRDEPKMFDSSVLVMKVLLSPKLDRCNSLPEVSSVYGRKLSASAQGLLDCLANLQLLDFGPSAEDGKKEKYRELMSMLKSLWLCDPKDSEKPSGQRNKCLDEEFKARSSSGVDVNSGSTGSGKSSVNDGTQAQINTECEVLETLTKVQEVDETVEGEASETPGSKQDSATPDRANQAQLTPETKDTDEGKLKDDVPSSEETIRSNDSPRELIETPLSSNKSSGNNPKKEDTESDQQEDTSSGSAPKQQRGQLSKRLSQDPDPIWVLNLLNKLEKQFMTHYVNAMAEFKVRWNLDDNEQLDAMICELQDEVRRRIQSSIDGELRKIQGRAGKPRPPKDTMSRESTIQTEQRRRRLKVMRDQSIDPQPAISDDDYTMTGTDFSDQRSDDEYCPCDTCLKKKMASKHVLPVEMLNSAPMMMDFDLRRILQMKKSAPNNEKIEETANEQASEIEVENAGLEAVKEEDEKDGADKEILASSAQEIEDEKQECEEDEEEDTPRHLKKDVDEFAQDEEQEKPETDSELMTVKESTSSFKMNELDEVVANYDIGESDDIMQTEAAKAEASEEHTEEESEQQDKTANDETAEDGKNPGTESVEEGETTAEAVAAGENEIPGCDTAEEGDTAEGQTADGQMAEYKTLRDGEAAEDETAEDGQTSEDVTGEECETVNDDNAKEHEIAENEILEDGRSPEYETGEKGESIKDEIGEGHETSENKTAEEGKTAEDETGEEGETVIEDNAEEHEAAESETAEDGQIAGDETGEEVETVNEETAEEHETAESETAEDGQMAGDETGEEGENVNEDTAEEHETAESETAEDGQAAEDETGEEVETVIEDTAEVEETAESETAEDGQMAGDETGEEGETVNEETAKEHETAESETAEDGQNTGDETGEEGETVNKDTVEVEETAESETAEEGQTAEDETGEEVETVNEETAEAHETAESETAEDGQTTGDETGEEGETINDDTAEVHERVENETVEECQTEDETGEEVETISNNTTEEHETAENGETDEDKTAEEGEMTEDKTLEDGQTAGTETVGEDEITEDETAGEAEASAENASIEGETESNIGDDETAEKSDTADNTVEEHEMAENESVEDGQAETARESDSGEEDTTKESKTAADEMAKNGQTAEAREGETDDDEPAEDEQNAEESETVEERDTAVGTSVEERGTDEDEDNTDDAGTAGGLTAEENETSEVETANEKTTEDETEISEKEATVEDSNTVEDKNAVVELAEQTPVHEMDKGQSNDEEDIETVSCEASEENVLSNIEDTESHVLTNLEVTEDETPLRNNGDIVLDSVDDKGEESGKEDDNVEVIASKTGYVGNTGESAEAGDEAEDDTEPDEGEHNRNTLPLQPLLQPKPKDDKPNGTASFNILVTHNSEFEDGADADVEDSETEEHNQVRDLSSESETKPQRKTAHKTFKMLIHSLNFLKLSAAGLPKSKEEDNEHEVEDEEIPEDGSDDAEESSCVEKEEVEENGKEKAKLSDITEDTSEGDDDQTNETSDDSEDRDWESSGNSLQKQITKSSLESQPGSFEEVQEEQAKKV